MWMSDALSRAAWVSSALIIRMIGASSSDSSRSSTLGRSCINRDRSMSPPTSSTTEAADPSCCEYAREMALLSSSAGLTTGTSRYFSERDSSASAVAGVLSPTQTSSASSLSADTRIWWARAKP